MKHPCHPGWHASADVLRTVLDSRVANADIAEPRAHSSSAVKCVRRRPVLLLALCTVMLPSLVLRSGRSAWKGELCDGYFTRIPANAKVRAILRGVPEPTGSTRKQHPDPNEGAVVYYTAKLRRVRVICARTWAPSLLVSCAASGSKYTTGRITRQS